MGDLSYNFSKSEFRCKHCNNLIVKPDLVSSLQELRDIVQRPIIITSGYRCKKHPESIRNPNSYHCKGMAADIIIEGLTVKEMYEYTLKIQRFKFGGIGLYDTGIIHVDIRPTLSRWGFIDGNYVSISSIMK